MNTAHTPGPWVSSEWGEILCAENRYIVARVATLDARLRGKEAAEAREILAANKALLAAAPALLVALQALHRICADCDLEVEGKRPTEDQYTVAMDAAEAAIAKATGAAS